MSTSYPVFQSFVTSFAQEMRAEGHTGHCALYRMSEGGPVLEAESGAPFHDGVEQRVLVPALRSTKLYVTRVGTPNGNLLAAALPLIQGNRQVGILLATSLCNGAETPAWLQALRNMERSGWERFWQRALERRRQRPVGRMRPATA